ncbi:MAG: hypothetical protein M0D53_04290 [Flavobacterium sp. JAD_PAG50586_2]|nr:MAG: hypothetical protein M0D53_04290 [Flavobacterium sp. JAD_PAG50586_2]
MIDFLIKKGDIKDHQVHDIKNGTYKLDFFGLYNDYHNENLIDGIYSFSAPISHTKSYFLIIDKSNYTILDISTREGLDMAIKNTLDFCEKQKYCSDFTEDYISRILTVYYRKNKNPSAGIDVNCENGITSKKDLP